ncbi:19526_t:CDS:10 [Rhizophagus irregularis]|nr:19526_t:CDS:10 [Rhizophagus irregularis]
MSLRSKTGLALGWCSIIAQKWSKENVLDSIKKDLIKVANSVSEFDIIRRRKAQEILDRWKDWTASYNDFIKNLSCARMNIDNFQVKTISQLNNLTGDSSYSTQNIDNRRTTSGKRHRDRKETEENLNSSKKSGHKQKKKRTKIEQYFPVCNDICEIQHEQRSFDNVDDEELSGITLVPPDELLRDAPFVQTQDKDETNLNLFDLEKDVENSYLQELSVETLNPTIERLLGIEKGIARYRITFLPEFHLNDPVKRLFTDKEWIVMESKWRKIEEEIVNSLLPIESNLQSLLKRYENVISQNTIGCYIDLNKVESAIGQVPFENDYLFARDWTLRWIQQVYTAFLMCFQTPINPLIDANASEYAYRSRIINRLWEEVFLDVNGVIYMKTGEVENTDRKFQLEIKRYKDKRNTNSGSWFHDAILSMNVSQSEIQVAFGEVVGNAYYHDDVKMNGDREKILKAMQLALFKIRQLFPGDSPNLKNLETYGILVYKRDVFFYSMHWIDGVYLVDQFDKFLIPNASTQLKNLSDIIRTMITFKPLDSENTISNEHARRNEILQSIDKLFSQPTSHSKKDKLASFFEQRSRPTSPPLPQKPIKLMGSLERYPMQYSASASEFRNL